MNSGDFALVVGINRYPRLRSLQGAVGDATRFCKWLHETAEVPRENIELVTGDDPTGEHPILHEIDSAFGRIFEGAKQEREPRRLYVYLAGHGTSQDLDHLALLMANASRESLNDSMNATEYRAALAQRFFPEQIYLFDCCRRFDDKVLGRGPVWSGNPGGAPVPGLVQLALFAAGFTEYANERHLIYDERRGLFTTALLEGLNGNAAAADGRVTTDRLVPYVRDRLDELSAKEGVRQHFWREEKGRPRSLVLATGVTPVLRRIEVMLPADTVRVVVMDDRAKPVEVKDVAPGENTVAFDLEMTVFSVIAKPSGVTRTLTVLPDSPENVDLRGAQS